MTGCNVMFLNALQKCGMARVLNSGDNVYVRFVSRYDYLQALRMQALPWVEVVSEQSYDGQSTPVAR